MNYIIQTKDNIRYITIPKLTELGLKHCFTTSDMDIGFTTNGSVESIKENLQSVYDFLNIKPSILYNGFQTHSNNIAIVKNMDQGLKHEFGRYFPETDGLVTDIENIGLITRFADCTPIILYDPIKKVHANVHSGWKGTLQRIAANAIDIMKKEYNCDPKDIISVIGPTIGKDEFEVDKDVKEQFETEFGYLNNIILKKNEIKSLINLQEINKNLLIESGIIEDKIIIIDLPTISNEILHSYRRDKKDFGLMGVITIL
ncbi:MAG: peptidoglycan editing factor PgeF [Tissierellia bacterium]|nr:peptidoglycan editing factor PgeF [Tissierellia bacterium]